MAKRVLRPVASLPTSLHASRCLAGVAIASRVFRPASSSSVSIVSGIHHVEVGPGAETVTLPGGRPSNPCRRWRTSMFGCRCLPIACSSIGPCSLTSPWPTKTRRRSLWIFCKSGAVCCSGFGERLSMILSRARVLRPQTASSASGWLSCRVLRPRRCLSLSRRRKLWRFRARPPRGGANWPRGLMAISRQPSSSSPASAKMIGRSCVKACSASRRALCQICLWSAATSARTMRPSAWRRSGPTPCSRPSFS